jgi:hypothetical protein
LASGPTEMLRIISAQGHSQGEKAVAEGWAEAVEDELRPEYDLGQLPGGVGGKYYRQAKSGTNLVLIEPDLAKEFHDEVFVNKQRGHRLTAVRRCVIACFVWRLRRAAGLKA